MAANGFGEPVDEEASGEDLDEDLLVSAFMTCHSVAEVYDVEDIESYLQELETADLCR